MTGRAHLRDAMTDATQKDVEPGLDVLDYRIELDLWEGAPPAAWEARWGVPRFEAWARLASTFRSQ